MTTQEIIALDALLNKARLLQERLARAKESHKMLADGKPLNVGIGDSRFLNVVVFLDDEDEKAVRFQVQMAVHKQMLRYQEELDRLQPSI